VVSELRKVFSDCSIAGLFCGLEKSISRYLERKPSISGNPEGATKTEREWERELSLLLCFIKI
jgi:hypothetical protein